MRDNLPISYKANRVLNIVLLAFVLIFMRVWFLSFIQKEEHIKKALHPQRKTQIDKAERAAVLDRFGVPLACNVTQYSAAVRYADIRQVPTSEWKKDKNGKKYREPLRARYIQQLSQFLASELGMDATAIEDTVHAKASLFPHTPFIIKEDLSEEKFFRLKMLEKDWLGMEAIKNSKRVYPMGRVGCDVVGYMSSISEKEYVRIAEEIKTLQEYLEKRDNGELTILPKGYSDPIAVRQRLRQLQQMSYTINDLVGKAGVEAFYEQMLRGSHGKEIFEVDQKGNTLRMLPSSRKSVHGQTATLTISAELQEYAEALLAHNEQVRHARDDRRRIGEARPWILGGAIVVMDPSNAEVLALASYPRYDPNDFIPSKTQQKDKTPKDLLRWLETEGLIEELWDGRRPLVRERYNLKQNHFYEERQQITLPYYLNTILPSSSTIKKVIESQASISQSLKLVIAMYTIMQKLETDNASAVIELLYPESYHIRCKKVISKEVIDLLSTRFQEMQDELLPHKLILDKSLKNIRYNDDKLLTLDILRLILSTSENDYPHLLPLQSLSLASFFELNQTLSTLKALVKEEVAALFHEREFQAWRSEHAKAFLKDCREQERKNKRYTRPYTDYLEKQEKLLFKEFWDANHPQLLSYFLEKRDDPGTPPNPKTITLIEHLKSCPAIAPLVTKLKVSMQRLSYDQSVRVLSSCRSFASLTSDLWGKYRMLRHTKSQQQLKHLAAAFYPLTGYGYGRSQAFRQSAAQGSVFKLVIAYEAMCQKYLHLAEKVKTTEDLSPITLIDSLQAEMAGTNKQILGYLLNGQPIYRFYKGGLLPRTHAGVGKIDLRGALEQSSNWYFSYLAIEHIDDPLSLARAAKNMGYGSKTGIDLPGEIAGSIPKDLCDNKTGLYSFAIGQHSLVVTPLQTCVMLSTIATSGNVIKPHILKAAKGTKPHKHLYDDENSSYPFKEGLALIGIHFPMFSEAQTIHNLKTFEEKKGEILQKIFMPAEVRTTLLEGMEKVINGVKGTARPWVIKALWNDPKIMKDYMDMRFMHVGKTGTAETVYKQWIDAESKAEIVNNIWFGGISFHPNSQGHADTQKPELVVAVYLRYSDTGGKEAAPLAAQIISKWRQIQARHSTSRP